MGSEIGKESLLDYRNWPRLLWLVIPIGLGRFALPIAMGWPTTDGSEDVITIPENWVVDAMRWALPGSAIALLLLGVWRRRIFPPPWIGGIGCAIALCSFCFMGARGLSDDVAGPDGATYVFFFHEVFQGRMAYLGRVSSHGLLTRTVQRIEEDEGEFGFNFASLVRPAGATSDGTWVALAPGGLVLGMVGQDAFRGTRVGGSKPLTAGEVAGLSPFILLGASRDGDDADVTSIIGRLRENLRVFGPKDCFGWAHSGPHGPGDYGSGTPAETSLLEALDSPNAWIRDASRRIVEAGGEEIYPEATKRLAAAPK